MPEQARLRLYGQGGVEVEFVAAYLADLKYAYESLVVFEAVVDGMRRAARDFPSALYFATFPYGWPLSPRRAVGYMRDWPPTPEGIATFVPRSEQLVLSGVQLSSPGFWDFLGKLNPLEVIRQYLNDRHMRRQDREYRESAEKRRLALENLKLENEVIADRVRIAKEIGATDKDFTPLLNELVYKPLAALDRHQDRGVIEHAEIPRPPDRRDGQL
jgi:hypothetical protein